MVFDYSYDSGDEWEEEEIEGVEELISENGSQGEGEDELEEDDWLVDDEVIEMASGASRSVSPHTNPSIDEKKKRKAESNTTIAAKKRRQIAGPLIPFSKGPIYEDVIGLRDYELFNDHSIHLFNGKPRYESLGIAIPDQGLLLKILILAWTLSLSSPPVLRTTVNSWCSLKLERDTA